jgi:hypothetical protein
VPITQHACAASGWSRGRPAPDHQRGQPPVAGHCTAGSRQRLRAGSGTRYHGPPMLAQRVADVRKRIARAGSKGLSESRTLTRPEVLNSSSREVNQVLAVAPPVVQRRAQ